MTDLLNILPSFPQSPFAALLPTIEKHRLSTTDLLALHPADIAKQTHLPLLDLKRLIAAIQVSLSDDLVPRYPLQAQPFDHGAAVRSENEDGGGKEEQFEAISQNEEAHPPPPSSSSAPENPQTPQTHEALNHAAKSPNSQSSSSSLRRRLPRRISTLDPIIDAALSGGIPTSSITEITGESGAGKTQFLLTLCLAVQLPPPHGLSKQALYISTESGLATGRLSQILSSNATLQDVPPCDRPSLDNILSTATPDLESQDHILEYQVPVLLSRHNIGLVVIDSVAANYRAEFERAGSSSYGSNMAVRSAALVRLGALLRDLARRNDLAVVVANQVADRFASPAVPRTLHARGAVAAAGPGGPGGTSQESPLASRSMPPPPASSAMQSTPSSSMPFSFPTDEQPPPHPALRLDHQQRWFTGWGDDPRSNRALKTPSLGLVWSTQISCRIALFKRPVYGRPRRMAGPIEADDGVEVGATLKNWRRWMKVVFASHVAASGQGLDNATEFEVTMGGLRSVQPKKSKDER
ncbi:DNA repair protein rhp57 [Conoideocrella luteorostrata]|uniref:DNA repair protein rhp57 n=1 Tax=Conoideocrella luteorostrata TaxID=1105319 RepID=A0AAJ0FUC8_9HYPO|nr:DNA repair protein rhp57 [Conoideocrella luteorostrata]